MDAENWPILTGTSGLILSCFVLFCGFLLVFLYFWLFLACLFDAFRKDRAEFKDRDLWIWILIRSTFIGLSGLAAVVYYISYRPKLRLW